MRLVDFCKFLRGRAGSYKRSQRANVAIIFAISLVPISVAAGAGLDLARAMVVRQRLSAALDAAGLAVGATRGLTQQQMTTLAQEYFSANYDASASLGTPAAVTVQTSDQQINVSSSVAMPTVLVRVADLIGCTGCDTINIGVTSQITWGQTKLWVGLVLDNTGSMTQTDGTGTSKISALKTATHQLLTLLQNAAVHDGDVQVAIVPFSKDVNIGTVNTGASWLDWTYWQAAPPSSTPANYIGYGSSCPYGTNKSPYGYGCQTTPTNGSSSTTTIPNSGTYKGYICPTMDNGAYNTGTEGRYYNGCYNSTITTNNGSCTGSSCSCPTGSVNCSCSGSGSSKHCSWSTFTHAWVVNAHSTWGGCVTDRSQDYDVQNTTPGSASTNFSPENAQSCPPGKVGSLSYNWTNLSNQVDSMVAQGSTNQTIGLAWGWQALSQGDPLNAPALPSDTQEVIILLSDGLNTQDRWYGDGSNQSSQVDSRMSQVCTNVKAQKIIVYTVFVDLNGTQGNSTVLQNCATDSTKYFDLKTSGAIIDTFNQIGTQITQLRLSL